MDVFRFFRPTGEGKEDRPEKRKAQVWRAQQAYRVRKDQYTKSFECEVARLRTIKTNPVLQTQHLCATIQMLEDLLANHGIYTPAGRESGRGIGGQAAGHAGNPFDPSSHAGKDVQPDMLGPQGGAVARPVIPKDSFTGRSGEPLLGASDSVWPKTASQDDFLTGWQDRLRVLPCGDGPRADLQGFDFSATSRNRPVRLGDLDPTTVGMEFVLALEAPCLDHIHGDPENPHQPSGHALTISAHLLFLVPTWPPGTKALDEACGTAPASVLNRLLTLSTDIDLEGEVTPVQAWNRIRSQPQFGGLEVDRLQSLTKKLGEAVKCHGFGAVLKETVLEMLVRETLVEGRSF